MIGTIKRIVHEWGSGIAVLVMSGDRPFVPSGAGPLFRALRDAFGDNSPVGRRIEFETDSLGVLTAFTPVGECAP